jgi:hypothetical protein
MSMKTEAAGAIKKAISRGAKKKAGEEIGSTAGKAAVKAFGKDSAEKLGAKLSPQVENLVEMAKMAAKGGNKEMAEKSFVSAAQAAQGTLAGSEKNLAEVLRVAQIAHHTEGTGDAAKLILTGARDKFTDYGSKVEIAASADKLGQKALHLDLMKQMATFSPTTLDHVALADQIAKATGAGYKPLIPLTLTQGMRRATTLADIQAVQMGAMKHGENEIFTQAGTIGDRLIEQGHTGAGNFSQTIQDVLRELGIGR